MWIMTDAAQSIAQTTNTQSINQQKSISAVGFENITNW